MEVVRSPPCVVALVGWALEYPVVYVQDEGDDGDGEADKGWEGRGNCLGGVGLRVVRIFVRREGEMEKEEARALLSFSLPEGMVDEKKVVEHLQAVFERRVGSRVSIVVEGIVLGLVVL